MSDITAAPAAMGASGAVVKALLRDYEPDLAWQLELSELHALLSIKDSM